MNKIIFYYQMTILFFSFFGHYMQILRKLEWCFCSIIQKTSISIF